MRLLLHVLLLAAALGSPDPLSRARASTWLEDFSTDPAVRGWTTHGEPGLFSWDAARGRIAATWDSSRTNTFFHRPLGTVLSRTDSFRFGFAVQLDEIRTASPDTTFQIALGLIRAETSFRTNLFRGSGVHPATGPRDIVEFNYFPSSRTISPTASAVAVGTNNLRWTLVNLFPIELTPGERFDIEVRFDAPTQTLHLDILRAGAPWVAGSSRLDTRFTDLRLDTFALISYSGAGQPAGYGGEVFARGWIDDLTLEFPDPPVTRVTLRGSPGETIIVATPSVPGWFPTLETGPVPHEWLPLDLPAVIDGSSWIFRDPTPSNPGTPGRFYRVRLDRP